jgi:hypothetical protein
VATGSRLYNALPLKMASALWRASIVKKIDARVITSLSSAEAYMKFLVRKK